MRLYKRVPDTDERGHTVVYELATPSEIAAAHPKCFTCGHWHYDTDDHSGDIGFCHFWTNEMGTTDYCPHHTELTKPTGGDDV